MYPVTLKCCWQTQSRLEKTVDNKRKLLNNKNTSHYQHNHQPCYHPPLPPPTSHTHPTTNSTTTTTTNSTSTSQMSMSSIPEWGTIYTVKFSPSVSLGLELWRVPHRIPRSLRSQLPEINTMTPEEQEQESQFDICTVHRVLPGGTADLHLGADIRQGDLLVALNGDSLVGYFRHAPNLKLEVSRHMF